MRNFTSFAWRVERTLNTEFGPKQFIIISLPQEKNLQQDAFDTNEKIKYVYGILGFSYLYRLQILAVLFEELATRTYSPAAKAFQANICTSLIDNRPRLV